uniref:Uncharacterized protein n=1 Tax=Cucumis melo TaxID=3656 RepID=A0A9I9DV63_CUCME
MAVEDDFSFPTALEPFNRCGVDSPPLWRLSPSASPISYRQQISCDRNFRDTASDGEISNRFPSASFQRRRRLMKTAELEENEIVKARQRMAELNLPETSGAMATGRKATGKTAFVKVLKKLFLMHSSSRRNLQTRSR